MTNANYTTTATPQLKISCQADLQIFGTTDNVVTIDIKDNSPASRIDRQEEVIVVTAMRDCDISCPVGALLTIEHASGDLRVTQVKGTLTVNAVNGDAVLHDVGPVTIQSVQGDLSLRDASGDVQFEVVRGDAKLKRVTGNVALNKVAGDLIANDLEGGLAVSNVGGDATLQTSLAASRTYLVKAGGDIILRVTEGGGQFTLNCKGDLRVRLPMANWTSNDRSATGTYGDGSAQVTLTADGDLIVLPGASGTLPFDPDALSEQVEAMIESAMSQFESQMSRVQHDLEQRFGKLDKHAEKAAERAARSAERAKRRAEHAAGAWSFSIGRNPPPPPSEPVSDQERLMILKMVEEGKITADQAAQLLSALEG
ncbi:MAG TPA: DUF4097 family beta strand repeat-containing protein [Anaerolineae bacterium]|nr:DUF4097 family beta strand repeat-containing protein [Anaerolineae bacterium]